MSIQEIWKDVKHYEGLYQVSNLGRVKALFATNNQFKPNRIINGEIIKKGHIRVSLKGRRYMIHRLVAQAFMDFDISDKKMFVCHKDDNPGNNHVDNLFIGTHTDNMRDAKNKGRKYINDKHHMAILKEKDIPKIREYISNGFSNIEIGRKFGVDHSTISKIRTNKHWTHIT